MESHEPKRSPPSDRPSFFGLPPSLRWWSHAGARFWGGLLLGLGIGLLIGATLVELEWMTLQSKAWVCAVGIVVALIGGLIARGAILRNR